MVLPTIYCPICDSAATKDTLDEAEETVEAHNEDRHGGEAVARVFEEGIIPPDDVNELYERLREESMEHRERFARRVLRDDRFRITEDDDGPDRDDLREWVVKA